MFPATARLDSTPPSEPGRIVYGALSLSVWASASAEYLSDWLCSPTGVFQISLPVLAFMA